MTLSVIGTGFGRTGTKSLKLALEYLGFGPCYHMVEVFAHPEHADVWHAAIEAPADWDALLSGYGATVDWPSTYFWRELIAAYPNAKVILTSRDPDRWYDSCWNTIFQSLLQKPDEPNMARSLVRELTFDDRLDDRAHCIDVFQRHNAEVRQAIPAERLLDFQVKQGWEPLCAFLGVDVPTDPFPRVNSTAEFQSRMT